MPKGFAASSSVFVAVLALGLAVGATSSTPAATDAPRAVAMRAADGGAICGLVYGQSAHAVVLVHGGRYLKESWEPQAHSLARAGFTVLAIDLRGFGCSTGPGQADPYSAPLYLDVLAAVRYLRTGGADSVSVVGASMGGWAAADAVAREEPGEISRLILLGAGAGERPPGELAVPKLLIVSREDRSGDGLRLPGIEKSFEKMPEPKRLFVVSGSAHAQAIFATSTGKRVMRQIVEFLAGAN